MVTLIRKIVTVALGLPTDSASFNSGPDADPQFHSEQLISFPWEGWWREDARPWTE